MSKRKWVEREPILVRRADCGAEDSLVVVATETDCAELRAVADEHEARLAALEERCRLTDSPEAPVAPGGIGVVQEWPKETT